MAAAAMLLSPSGLSAQEKTQTPSKFKFYGFFRNFAAFDTRDSYAGTEDLFYFAPKDENIVNGEDLNANPQFRSLAITSRLGLDFAGYQYGATKISGKVETDFYSKNGSAAVLRVRQVYVDFGWDELGRNGENSASLRFGQAWHPMAADQPNVVGLETGSPFNAFSRTPQLTGNYNIGKNITLTAGLIGQMQYRSGGPAGSSTDYLKYGVLPEIYAGVTVKTDVGLTAKAGVDILSIKPRWKTSTSHVEDRLTTVSPFIFAQYTNGLFQLRAKSLFASAGEHLNLRTGYGVSAINSDGTYEYSPMRSVASFVSACYGKKWQVLGMVGYLNYLGTSEEVSKNNYYCSNDGYNNMTQMWRFTPTLQYNAGKLQIALEYNLTTAEYGDKMDNYMLPTTNFRWVTNHRILTMVKFNF